MQNIIFEYFIKNFSLFYNFPLDLVSYGNKTAKINIRKEIDDDFFEKKEAVCKNYVFKIWKNKSIPFLFAKAGNKNILTVRDNKIFINYDIVASTFYLLSGYDEIVSEKKDNLNRIKFENSIVKKLNIVEIPVVNYYFDILFTALQKIDGNIKKKNIWGEYNFATFLSHDIDLCESAWLEGGKSELKRGKLLNLIKLILLKIFKKDDWFNFDRIIEYDKLFSASSTFFFLPKKGKMANLKNADYDIRKPKVQKVLRNLDKEGFEIAVHGSFGTHLNYKNLIEDIKKFNSEIVGNRFHFLMFDNLITPYILDKSNIKYDSTLGFAEHIGFRRATCFPFYLFDYKNYKILNTLEIPLIVMDATLRYKKYMGLSQNNAFYAVKPIIEEVIKFSGVFTILWHNTFFSDYKYTGWKEVYKKILTFLKENKSLLTNGKTIIGKLNK